MRSVLLGWLLVIAAPASADVVSASANGFEVRETVPLVVPPEAAFKAFADLPAWWNPEHTYSGDSANLRLELTPGGCFCERIPKSGGGVEHMHVAYIEPGKRVVLTGSLGPLLYEATTGVMDVQVKTIAGGSQLTLDVQNVTNRKNVDTYATEGGNPADPTPSMALPIFPSIGVSVVF